MPKLRLFYRCETSGNIVQCVKGTFSSFTLFQRVKKMKEVTAAIILKNNKVLIAQRAPGENLEGK